MDTTLDLWQAYKAEPDRIDLRNQLVGRYLYLVHHQAQKLMAKLPPTVSIEDLVANGTLGLLEAIRGFDLDRGLKFSTYAPLRIRGAMLDGMREMDWVPRLARTLDAKLRKASEELFLLLGRTATDEELAAHLKLTLDQLYQFRWRANVVAVSSLDKRLPDEADHKQQQVADTIASRRVEDPRHSEQSREQLRQFCRGLNRQERLIVILYYYEGLTMKEIGRTLDLSESRISQMHSEVLERIRSRLAAAS